MGKAKDRRNRARARRRLRKQKRKDHKAEKKKAAHEARLEKLRRKQDKKNKKHADKKAKHDIRRLKRKNFFKQVGKGTKAVFHEVKTDVTAVANVASKVALNPLGGITKSLGGGLSTTIILGGGVAVAVMVALR